MEEARSSFEQSWQDQFDGAELAPPPHVWVAIDGALANEEISSYKKKTQVYQWVAVACLFLLTLGGVYYNLAPKDNEMADETMITESEMTNEVASKNETSQKIRVEPLEPLVSSVENSSLPSEKVFQEGIVAPVEEQEEMVDPDYRVLSQQRLWLEENQLVSINNKEPNAAIYASNEKLDQIYGVPDLTHVSRQEDYERLWAGVNVSAGSFDPGFGTSPSTVSNADFLGFSPTMSQGESRSDPSSNLGAGSSVSGGLSVGSRINKYLVLSSGVQYNAFTAQGQDVGYFSEESMDFVASDALSNDTNRLAEFVSGNADQLVIDEIDITNEYQYLTVPIKAGVILLDKKVNIVLNTGVSSNFLINSTLQAVDYDEERETSENYKNVYFNFLSSVEIGYNVNEKYLISVEPNYNQAISEFTNSNNINQGKPRNFGVAVGVKYNF